MLLSTEVYHREVNSKTLFELLKIAKFKVFDVNVRAPHYSLETIKALINEANLLKCNEEELFSYLNIWV